jgi:diguanylate cyclase (GGDEF)-like protein
LNEFHTTPAEGQPGPYAGATPPEVTASAPVPPESPGGTPSPDEPGTSAVLGGAAASVASVGREGGGAGPGPGEASPPRVVEAATASHAGFRQDIDGALGELPSLLARSATGLEFIYQSLELVAARYGLRDLVVVVDRPDHHQIFRLGRAPLEFSREPLPSYLTAAFAGRPGLYAEPPVVGPLAAACLTSLVELALRLDLLTHDASHDALTGLLNRRSYELLLDQAVSRARRYGWPFALVVLDLDDFKVVNDRYGHAAGDAALRAVGAELRAALRGGDVAARLGGDEFALLVVGVENVASLSPLLGRLKRALERAVPETTVGFSVGVACFPSDTDDPDALTGLADERLYAAKATIG